MQWSEEDSADNRKANHLKTPNLWDSVNTLQQWHLLVKAEANSVCMAKPYQEFKTSPKQNTNKYLRQTMQLNVKKNKGSLKQIVKCCLKLTVFKTVTLPGARPLFEKKS